MVCTITELAKMYGVSKMAVSSWKLKGTKQGTKLLIDTEDETNKQILSTKTKKKEQTQTPPAPKPKTADGLLPPPPSQTPEFEDYAEFLAYKDKLKLQTAQTQANKAEQLAFFEIEKLKLQIENSKLDIEKQKIIIAAETKKQEIQDGKYISTEIIQRLIDDTTQAVIALENEIIEALNYNNELQGEMIFKLRKIFRDRQNELVSKWEKTTTDK